MTIICDNCENAAVCKFRSDIIKFDIDVKEVVDDYSHKCGNDIVVFDYENKIVGEFELRIKCAYKK